MAELILRVVNAKGETLAEHKAQDQVFLVYMQPYQEGDRIELSASEKGIHVIWQADDALGQVMCYLTENVSYLIPFGEKKRVYSPKAFSGSMHYLYAREARPEEIAGYRNLALNPLDQHDVVGCYPHASANVETRGESVFAAKNAIDGVCENHGHGNWPFASWGINRDPNAQIRIDFGRTVSVDQIAILLRADFPHDSYWTEGTVSFSDGTKEVLKFEKTDRMQYFMIQPRAVDWLTFDHLIKADDDSPFPALSQIQVFGRDFQ